MRRTPGPTPKGGGEEEERKDRFSTVMELVQEKMVELFLEEKEGEPYLSVFIGKDASSGMCNLPIRSREFDGWVNGLYFHQTGRGLREDVRKDVKATLEAMAFTSGKRRALELLAWVSEEEKKILVDVGDELWHAVEITPEGWRIIQPEDVPPFKRSFLAHRLEVQETTIPPEESRTLLSTLIPPTVEEELREDFTTFFPPWLCSVFLTHIPRTGLLFTGPQGSGKSVAQRLIAKLLTGREVQGGLSRDPKDLAVKLQSHPVIVLDNLRGIPSWMADALSSAITGAIFPFRRLYTDREVSILEVKRVVLLNGISPGIYQYPDLMDKLVAVSLRRLEPGERREERELEEEFARLRPRILAGIFSSLSRAWHHLEEVRKEVRERGMNLRMVDFAIWGEAVARGMGYQPLEWLKAYARLVGETVELVLEEDPLAKAVLRLAEDLLKHEDDGRGPENPERIPSEGRGWWVGTGTDLLRRLENTAEGREELEGWREEGFPRNAWAMGRRIRALIPALQDKNIVISYKRVGERGTRLYTVRVPVERKGEGERLMTVEFLADYPGGLVSGLPKPIPGGVKIVLPLSQAGELRRKFGFVRVTGYR